MRIGCGYQTSVLDSRYFEILKIVKTNDHFFNNQKSLFLRLVVVNKDEYVIITATVTATLTVCASVTVRDSRACLWLWVAMMPHPPRSAAAAVSADVTAVRHTAV